MNSSPLGTLYIVATPIGNLADISERARTILSSVDLIAAEDTRHSGILLSHLKISNKMISLHKYNETERSVKLIERLNEGQDIALISDAGTPLISDPGYRLVDQVHQAGLNVVPIPGASSVTAALSVCGFDTDQFIFIGFLPSKSKQAIAKIESVDRHQNVVILFEAPHRIAKTVDALISVYGDAALVCFCREITKVYETIKRLTLSELKQWISEDSNQSRGEIVLLMDKQAGDIDAVSESIDVDVLIEQLASFVPIKHLQSTLRSAGIKMPRNELYQKIIKAQNENQQE